MRTRLIQRQVIRPTIRFQISLLQRPLRLPLMMDDDDANADPMSDTQMDFGATATNLRWTLEEDAKLTTAVAKNLQEEVRLRVQSRFILA
jgi:hypothetical protein